MKSTTLGLIALLASGLAAAQSPPSPPPGGPDDSQRQAQHAAMLAACDADIKNFCASEQGRGVMKCLHTNMASLSTSCKNALPKHHPPGDRAPPPPTT